MFAHMSHAASARANATPTGAAQRPSGFSALPLEVLGGICSQLGKADLAKLARTCHLANGAAERRLFTHINLVRGEPELGAAWRKMGPAPSHDMPKGWVSQNAYRQLIRRLQNRFDLANAVKSLTVSASYTYPRKLADLVNFLKPTLNELVFRPTTRPDLHVPFVDPYYVYGHRFFDMVAPLPFVTKMSISLAFDWEQTWRCALAATPFLTDLTMAPLYPYGNGWEREYPEDPSRRVIFHGGRYVDAPLPKLPHLKFLFIVQMATELEVSIMELLKTSSAPTITLCWDDPAGHYYVRSETFTDFIEEWQKDGRLKLKLALPIPEWEEIRFFQEEEDEAFKLRWERDMERWAIEREMEENERIAEGEQEAEVEVDFICRAGWALHFWTSTEDEQAKEDETKVQVDDDGWPIEVQEQCSSSSHPDDC